MRPQAPQDHLASGTWADRLALQPMVNGYPYATLGCITVNPVQLRQDSELPNCRFLDHDAL